MSKPSKPRRRDRRGALAHLLAGVLATLAGMASGHLVAAFLDPASSPVLAVGSTVIDLTPTPVKEFAVATFGNADKPLLIGSVVLVTLVLAGIAGLLARRRLVVGTVVLLLLVGAAAMAALLRPAADATYVLPAAVTAVVGVASLWWLTRMLRSEQTPATPATIPSATGTSRETSTGPGTRLTTPSRRGFVVGSSVVAVGALAAGGGGQWITSYRTRPGQVALPAAGRPLTALPKGIENTYAGVTPFQTPNQDFYRVDVNLSVPAVAVDSWTLTIDGDVERPLTLTFDELAAMPLVERDITMTCVSNQVGGFYVGAARWRGVLLKDLLAEVGVGSKADQILSTAVDGFTISTPLALATDGRDAMVAIAMNGEPLPAEHGFPARMITPGIYGYVGATKWLERLTLTTYAADEAYWTERDWAIDAPIKPSARIDTPKALNTIDVGKTVIAGVAWAQHVGVGMVEVSIDGGPWEKAKLGPDAGIDYWRQWYLPWDAKNGQHELAVRVVDLDGDVQTDKAAAPFPNGSSGIQQIVVIVA